MMKAVHPLWHQHCLMAQKIQTLALQQLICMENVPELIQELLLLLRKLLEFFALALEANRKLTWRDM